MKMKTVDKYTVIGSMLLIFVGVAAIAVSLGVGVRELVLLHESGTDVEFVAALAIVSIMVAAGFSSIWAATWVLRDRARDRRREKAGQQPPFPG